MNDSTHMRVGELRGHEVKSNKAWREECEALRAQLEESCGQTRKSNDAIEGAALMLARLAGNGSVLVERETLTKINNIAFRLNGGGDAMRDEGHKLWLALCEIAEVNGDKP